MSKNKSSTGKPTKTSTQGVRNVKSDSGSRSKTASDAKGTGGLGAGKTSKK